MSRSKRMLPTRRRRTARPPIRWEWAGDPDATVLIAGHSHRAAFTMAVDEGLSPGVAVLGPGPEVDPSTVPQRMDPTYWRFACDTEGRVLAVVWNGNQHTYHFLFDSGEPFRLHDSGQLGTVVPASMISAFWEQSLLGLEEFQGSVRAEHFVLLGTPPPKSEEDIRAGLMHSPVLLRVIAAAGESAETIRITPTPVRVRLWAILQRDLEAWAARLGAIFVPVPSSARAVDGCLKSEYSGQDASHANGAFGALMVGEIEAALAEVEAPRA